MSLPAGKPRITLSDAPLCADQNIVWKFQTGVEPYQTVMSCYETEWEKRLKALVGKKIALNIVDSRNKMLRINGLYILYRVPSNSPKRISFVVSDRRWKWRYIPCYRDFNVITKSGDRNNLGVKMPTGDVQTIDEYDYKAHTLDGKKKWTARSILEWLLKEIEGDFWTIEGLPVDSVKNGEAGQFSIQNMYLRDNGDAALARVLALIPGTEVYVDETGRTRVIDAADVDNVRRKYNLPNRPAETWEGDLPLWIDRKAIRPRGFNVNYVRELELLARFKDDWSDPSFNVFGEFGYTGLQNVIPTVDLATTVTEIVPGSTKAVTRTVPPGTYVDFAAWLAAMDKIKPAGSRPWTFDTISLFWTQGGLEGVLNGIGSLGKFDKDPQANVATRIQNILTHFRQTFRLHPQLAPRLRELRATRVGVFDPISGTKARSLVWSQYCAIPSNKGTMTLRRDPNRQGLYRNFDMLETDSNKIATELEPGPGIVSIIDADQGIFRIDYPTDRFGVFQSFIPCVLCDGGNGEKPTVPNHNFAKQDSKTMGVGFVMSGTQTQAITLSPTMELAAILTVVPAAPNNRKQFHTIAVDISAVEKLYKTSYKLQGGEGPPLSLFIPPGEMTARWAWDDDQQCRETFKKLLGLNDLNNPDAGLDVTDLPGFIPVNADRTLMDHAVSAAMAEMHVFGDSMMGRPVTPLSAQTKDVRLTGNQSATQISVSSAPSAIIRMTRNYPGQIQPISRFALMREETRRIVLGILPLKNES